MGLGNGVLVRYSSKVTMFQAGGVHSGDTTGGG